MTVWVAYNRSLLLFFIPNVSTCRKKAGKIYFIIDTFDQFYTLNRLSKLFHYNFRRWLYRHAVAFSDLTIMNMLIAGTQGPSWISWRD